MIKREPGTAAVSVWIILLAVFSMYGCSAPSRGSGVVLLLVLSSQEESSESVSGAAVFIDSLMNTAAVVPLTVSGSTAELLSIGPDYSIQAGGAEAAYLLEIFRALESGDEREEGRHAAAEFSGVLYRNASLFLEDVVFSHIQAVTDGQIPDTYIKKLLQGAASGELELKVMPELRIDITDRKGYLYVSEYLAQLHRAIAGGPAQRP